VSYECRILQLVLLEEGLYVFGESGVVVDLIVGGFAVVSRVDGIYRPLEDACECTRNTVLVETQLRTFEKGIHTFQHLDCSSCSQTGHV
jgi:hypothetical protein